MASDGDVGPSPYSAGIDLRRTYDGMDFVSYMWAGAVAGITEHTAMFPLDTIKTRAQALGHPGQQLQGAALRQALKAITRREGFFGLYSGIGAMVGGAGPAHALYFATYEAAKEVYGANRPGQHPVAAAASGATATVLSDACMTPADVVKQRLQIANSPYRGVLDCVVRVLREEGAYAFYRSYWTTLVMNVPHTAVQVSVYESCKKLMGADEDDRLSIQLVAGGVAGGAAAAITNPLDVVKTRLQTEGVTTATKYSGNGVISTLRQIVQEEGWVALLRGLKPRVLYHIPAAAVCWGTYESMKGFLGANGGKQE
ncbi:hypothetical protein BSKO_08451 [Bryopsis sp. KO-2023]|nr:hypothetical protein BSKO_08451 [Bryopsis sp. KO-2023]